MTKEELEKENAELKEHNRKLLESCEGATMMYEHLTKATKIIKKFWEFVNDDVEFNPEHSQEHIDMWNELYAEAEQFLKELDKMTKEELEKEAEEYAYTNWTDYPEKQEIAEKAYLAGVKPREKRIAELEQDNLKLSNEVVHHKNEADFFKGANKNLREEIKELKQKNKELQHGCEGATMLYNKVQEAKTLIENIIRVTWGEGWNYSLDWKKKAEEFLEM